MNRSERLWYPHNFFLNTDTCFLTSNRPDQLLCEEGIIIEALPRNHSTELVGTGATSNNVQIFERNAMTERDSQHDAITKAQDRGQHKSILRGNVSALGSEFQSCIHG